MATQLEFSWRSEDSLRSELEAHTGLRIDLTVTNNRRSMLTVRAAPGGAGIRLRIHHMFLAAGPQVLHDLARWLRAPRAGVAGRLVDEFIRDNQHLIQAPAERMPALVTRGAVHDLQALYAEVNAAHFEDAVTAAITWGQMPPGRRRRTIRFGSYHPSLHLIRIHPLLDQPFVPRHFVRYIVFHEMLHAVLGVAEDDSGRRRYHSREFARRERQYPEFARATAWQNDRRNLHRLLRHPK